MVGTLPRPVLRDELWICSNAMEEFFSLGINNAWIIYYSNNSKPKESSQIEWMKYYFCGYRGFVDEYCMG